ncbi:MAG TPA: hypothetical protein VEO37_12160, partial [Thermoanaerobaculia bacterium]|nr:hypothetical protein [Thermoanaerobaculia bacterium]
MSLVLCVALAATAAALPAPPTNNWRDRLRAAIERAVSQNPDLVAMEARIDAARHRALSAGALPDP